MNDAIREVLREAGARFETPCFVYLIDEVDRRIAEIDRAFGGRFQISYAIKANPHPGLLSRLSARVPFLDASSAGEIRRGLDAGFVGERISFTGPGKRDFELEGAVAEGVGEIVLESVEEARRLSRVAGRRGTVQKVLVRIAPASMPPGFGAQMAGRPCAFGVDEEVLEAAIREVCALPNLSLTGFHVYAGAQCLDEESIAALYLDDIRLFRRACDAAALAPSKLVFGAGLGIPYHEEDRPLSLDEIAAVVNPALDALRDDEAFRDCAFLLETGRYLVGEAGYYLTTVVSKKESRGTSFCVCDGGLNHNLAACGLFGMVIHRNYRFFKVHGDAGQDANGPVQLVGPLCSSLDTLARAVSLPPVEVGDVIGMRSAGGYGPTASPVGFISHAPPREVVVERQGDGLVFESPDPVQSET